MQTLIVNKEADWQKNRKIIIISWLFLGLSTLLFSSLAILICLLFKREQEVIEIVCLSLDLTFFAWSIVALLCFKLLPAYAERKILKSLNDNDNEKREGRFIGIKERTLYRYLSAYWLEIETSDGKEAYYLYSVNERPSFKEGEEIHLLINGRFVIGYETEHEESYR